MYSILKFVQALSVLCDECSLPVIKSPFFSSCFLLLKYSATTPIRHIIMPTIAQMAPSIYRKSDSPPSSKSTIQKIPNSIIPIPNKIRPMCFIVFIF